MKHNKRHVSMTRETVMKLLSDQEVTKMRFAGTTTKMADGEEYLDLDQLVHGVQHAKGSGMLMGSFLPRKLLGADTWSRILKHLNVEALATP